MKTVSHIGATNDNNDETYMNTFQTCKLLNINTFELKCCIDGSGIPLWALCQDADSELLSGAHS